MGHEQPVKEKTQNLFYKVLLIWLERRYLSWHTVYPHLTIWLFKSSCLNLLPKSLKCCKDIQIYMTACVIWLNCNVWIDNYDTCELCNVCNSYRSVYLSAACWPGAEPLHFLESLHGPGKVFFLHFRVYLRKDLSIECRLEYSRMISAICAVGNAVIVMPPIQEHLLLHIGYPEKWTTVKEEEFKAKVWHHHGHWFEHINDDTLRCKIMFSDKVIMCMT